MEEAILKKGLSEIKSQNYLLKDESLYSVYAVNMLDKIGTIDSTLRDDLIYDIFANWIWNDKFSHEEILVQ